MERTKNFPDMPHEVRMLHKRLRQNMTQSEVEEASRAICDILRASAWYKNSHWIYGYYPLGNEVDALEFLEHAFADGKRVALPRVRRTDDVFEEGIMDFYEISSLEQVEEGNFGVSEPLPSCPLAEQKDAIVLVPGLVFDREGNRYGYGKGYYDRYFARFPMLYKAALAYEHQLENTLVVSKTDVRMDCIYTERQRYLFAERTI